MRFDELKEILKTISYKPGWGFHLYKETDDLCTFRISWAAKNCGSPEDDIVITNSKMFKLEEMKSEKKFLSFVEERIFAAEEHEFREWFKYKSVQIYDPHPELSG